MDSILNTLNFIQICMGILAVACLICTIKAITVFVNMCKNHTPNKTFVFVMIILCGVATIALAYPLITKLFG